MEFSILDRSSARPVAQIDGRTSKRTQRAAFYSLTLMIDIIVIGVAFLIPSLMHFEAMFDERNFALFGSFALLYAGFTSRGFSSDLITDWRKGVAPAILALCTAAAITLTFAFLLKHSAVLSRAYVLVAFAFAAAGIVAARGLGGSFAKAAFGSQPFGVLVVTEGVLIASPADVELRSSAQLGVDGPLTDPIILDRLARCLGRFDRVIVACLPDRRQQWATALRASSVRADMVIPELDHILALGCDRFAGSPLVPISAGRMRVRDEVLKRALDVGIAGTALVFFAPLMLLMALLIKLDTPGPVFFEQQRVGLGNRLFKVLKFRSMRVAECDANGAVSTGRADSRITRIGRFIRATSIDELPQLLNVLRGEMSIVGPRPHALGSLAGDRLFWEVDQSYYHRHACKPGLTGLAQVRGYRGATERPEDLINRLNADLEYVHGWSIWRDIEIVCATLKVVVHRNAF